MRVGRGRKALPPPEGNAAGWGGRGRRVWDEPHDRAGRGRAPCKPRRGDHRGCRRRIEGATEGAARQTPPPPAEGREPRLEPATRGQRQENDKPPPPTCLRPPKGGGCRKGGAGSGLPSPAGGAPGECTQRGQGEDKGHAACLTPQQEDKCRAACQCRACDVLTPEEGQRGRSPPPSRHHLPHPPRTEARATGGRRGDKRDDGSGRRTPPGDAAAGWGDRGTRRPCPRGARAVQAPTGGTAGGATAGRVG